MDIPALKHRLDILEIAGTLGIVTNRNDKALCPFHNDKSPSLQFSREKQICTCFSSKCSAGTMDVVELVKKYKGWELPETLNWLSEQANTGITQPPKRKLPELSNPERIQLLSELYDTFTRSYAASIKPRKYLENRGFDPRKVRAGYNLGQFHHSVNLDKDKADHYRMCYESLGMLKYHPNTHGHHVFGKGCIVFPLKNNKGQIVSFYFRETDPKKKSQHYYLKNRQGLYPGYPKRIAQRLIITESIIDAETLIQVISGLKSRQNELPEDYEILACYGTEGHGEQLEAIKALEELKEVVLFFDGDLPGRKGAKNLAKSLLEIHPNLKIKIVATPEGYDVNSLGEEKQSELLLNLVKEAPDFFLSSEVESRSSGNTQIRQEQPGPKPPEKTGKNTLPAGTPGLFKLDTSHPHNIKYPTETAAYEIKGGMGKNSFDRLVVSLHIIHPKTRRKSRVRLDLYEDKQVEKTARESGEKLGLRSDLIEQDLSHLADLLDGEREKQQLKNQQEERPKYHVIPEAEKQEALALLTGKGKYKGNLIAQINKLIGRSGVVGEDGNRAFLFCIASSHKMPETLHALVQGSSGSGKTHLVRQISALMPEENVIRLTRVTESSFYNYGEYDLQNKLVVIEDYDGLKEEAELAFRELQSGDELRSQVSGKQEEYSSYKTELRIVRGPIGSMAATTKGAVYEDNLSRCFIIAVDESAAQTAGIIKYQNRRAAGGVNEVDQQHIKTLLQNSIRLLKPLKVINPFADKLNLPEQAHKIRRLNSNFQSFVKQITLLSQYQRSKAPTGELLTEKQDLATAIEIMFDSIILKVDELDGSLRLFYEELKRYIGEKAGTENGSNYEFSQREVRQTLRVSKTQMHRYINDLLELEYIRQTGGYANRGFKYKISYWDDIEKLRDQIKTDLYKQLEKL